MLDFIRIRHTTTPFFSEATSVLVLAAVDDDPSFVIVAPRVTWIPSFCGTELAHMRLFTTTRHLRHRLTDQFRIDKL